MLIQRINPKRPERRKIRVAEHLRPHGRAMDGGKAAGLPKIISDKASRIDLVGNDPEMLLVMHRDNQ
ncbi:hypothetical protein CEXT_395421 [Caerostris extrusa]|uniref:Uncharacterized protein n=1 Tax=Caerostris extrusa TaxID=172846 RepID=A0AAV4XBU1_CAEEX|nr:hypothetical protein CEXT_395421 [Caerostris extrusa]